jgi:XRE family transcriptional regulator, regulator of sulfur utilization
MFSVTEMIHTIGGSHNCSQSIDFQGVTSRKKGKLRSEKSPQDAFGAVLRELRLSRGFSQDAYAHHTGYHRNYIGQLERGEKSPSLNALFNIAGSFNLTPSRLLENVEKFLQFAKREP